jgi:alkanesulfonate monooxygenase SsuD/methylene tetrahydromethanopterin reductase-like flavin-dependent oxidoreductase (luciferase family)
VWMAASSEETIRMAGQNGLGLLCFSIMQPLDKLKALIDMYREEQKSAKPVSAVHTNKVGAYTMVHCTESRKKFETNRVWDSMWWWYRGTAEFILKWEMAQLPPEVKEKAFPLLKKQADGDFDIHSFDEQDMVIVGTPDECLRKFLKYEEAGVDQVLCYVNFGYLPQEAVLECITLLGDYVIPELKARGAKRMAGSLERSIALQAAV